MASENDRHEAYKNYIAANESTVLKGLKNWLLFGRPIAEASILYEIRKCLDPSNCLQTDGQTSLTAVSRPSMKTCKMKVYSWNVCSRLLIYIQPYRLSGFIEWKK